MEQNQQNNGGMNEVTNPPLQKDTTQIKGEYEIILNWYKINGKNLVDEEILKDLQINTLLKVLGNPIWNDIYHCWSIELKHIPNLQAYAKHKFEPEKFHYFIEVYHTIP